jgi:DNA-binding response OmpR family regulator
MPRRPLLLIVEDDPVLRELYRVALSVANFDVQLCPDGWSALQYLDQQRPDLIVLDLDLPRVSGVDIYKELRAHAVTHSVPIVVCTGSDAAADLPGATILRKPCAPDQLIATVERALRSQQRARLFVRGEESVRVVMEAGSEGRLQLAVYGPGTASAVFYDTDALGCAVRQAGIERALMAEGYEKVPLFFADRRSGSDRRIIPRASPDRRRQSVTPSELEGARLE